MADAKNLFISPGFSIGTSFVATNFVLDASTDAAEYIFQADEAISITRLGYRYGARTGTPPTYKISLQGVDGTGIPDGTIKGGGSPASMTFTPPADTSIDGLWQWRTLDNAYTTTRGEFLCIVIARDSGTVDASNNSSFTATDGLSMHAGAEGLPYSISNNAGARTRAQTRAVFGYGTSSLAYGFPVQSAFSIAAVTLSTTPDEWATRFIIPSSWIGQYQLAGVYLRTLTTATRNLKVQLYSGTTVLQSLTWDSDIGQAAGGSRVFRLMFPDTLLVALSPGAEYRVGFQPQEITGFAASGITVASNADLAAYPLGTDWYYSSRTDAGAWTDDTTTRVFCSLILKDISRPSPGIITAI